MKFTIKSDYKPTGDQPVAIQKLVEGLDQKQKEQVLLGVTGSGKTFSLANVIEKTNLPTLVISHNKTLAGQLYQEFRDFFPNNAVSYFVSYYDYYQPEAYIPATDTYIEKETEINEEIDKLRLATTANILTRKDVLVVASVSCIYNIGSPREYGKFVLELRTGMPIEREQILVRLSDLQYQRGSYELVRGMFRPRGENIDIGLAYQDEALRIVMEGNTIKKMYYINPVTGDAIPGKEEVKLTVIYPAKHYMTDPKSYHDVFEKIREDLNIHVKKLISEGKHLEAHRIKQRVQFDLEMIAEVGYVNGIENYSRYFDGRQAGDPPYSLLDYFKETYGDNWLLVIDESHMTVPQLHGMYNGDRARKQTLIDFGFRLPAALDNRPLKFEEFQTIMPQTIYVSATPDEWELERAGQVVEQLIRPTGLIDPTISVRKSKGQIIDLIKEITARVEQKQRVLVTTLTKRTAEDLAKYLDKNNPELKVAYLHSDIDTLTRQDILDDLRKGTYDVLVGINLLREGLDLPEVSLVAILDADKEGFLRSRTSLIQTMGRAARHENGQVIMYADVKTRSMKLAIGEVERRRKVQLKYNADHGITPVSIQKPIRDRMVKDTEKNRKYRDWDFLDKKKVKMIGEGKELNVNELTPREKKEYIKQLRSLMHDAARNLDFEEAARIRDKVEMLKKD